MTVSSELLELLLPSQTTSMPADALSRFARADSREL
jgi:hypothetical protein